MLYQSEKNVHEIPQSGIAIKHISKATQFCSQFNSGFLWQSYMVVVHVQLNNTPRENNPRYT